MTTSWVLAKLADGLAETPGRKVFETFIARLRSDPRATIVGASETLFEEGINLYCKRPDKQWSLTDCISFVVMTQLGISEALSADHHFEQAGFKLLMRE